MATKCRNDQENFYQQSSINLSERKKASKNMSFISPQKSTCNQFERLYTAKWGSMSTVRGALYSSIQNEASYKSWIILQYTGTISEPLINEAALRTSIII